ncbi:hypothetical protein [Streptomyces sp. YIM S03343]
MLVEADVVAVLQGDGGGVARVYAAGCVERMAQIFTGLRAGTPERGADVDFFIGTLQRLWDLGDSLDDFSDRVRRLEGFPEMQPPETGHTAVDDIYAFCSVLALRYAILCAGSTNAAEAERCGHIVLTAMGQLQQNVTGAHFYEEELDWQRRSIRHAGEAVDTIALRTDCAHTGRERLAALLAS